MARPQNRKRHRGDDPSQHHLPPKKARLNSRPSQSSNFAPEFYDDLSERSGLRLTPRALRELDRRNGEIQLPEYTIPDTSFTTLAEFARQNRRGGPNLCHLRGYTRPTSIARAMASTSSASSKAQQSTKATTVTSKSKRSSAYDANFEQHLINNNIYPPLYRFPDGCRTPKPANWEEIRRVLRAPRASLSPSRIPESAFEDFQVKNTTKSEGTVMRSVFPILAGDADILNEGHLPFVNLDSITKNTTVNPVPDFFDGAEPAAVDRQGDDLVSTIEDHDGGSSPLDFYDCQLFAEPDDDDQETQETKIGLGILQTYGKDDAADQERDLSRRDTEASTAFATSFASSLTSDLSQPKLPRTPPSPSSSRVHKKRGPVEDH
ncbi:hypothetical protein H9Q69_010362 [Fusarium xylarioides]|nr:hypothetical protein H9Q69_010362 [Fusarium xylarioides]